MLARVKELIAEVNDFKTTEKDELEQFRIRFLGKKGVLNDLFAAFKSVDPSQKKDFGQALNELKNNAQEKIEQLKASIHEHADLKQGSDLSKMAEPINLGSRHPLSVVRNDITAVFSRLGYTVSEGPEIEDDWHNFSALNFPESHPARDMQDTFFIEKNPDMALRTHTSSVQVRVMEENDPPIRTISPGRVFRNEAISARAHCIFHQVEGLYIDKGVSFADLKQTILYFVKTFFGADTDMRFRPSFFPFTEPSAEVDISCNICHGKGCNVCKYSGYVEIMGCGMVDPNVLKSCDIDPEVYSGFAFGMGIERIAMLKYQVNDLRLFFENDVRFLEQFQSV